MNTQYQLALLYLVRLLIDADGVAAAPELEALQHVKQKEGITDEFFHNFQQEMQGMGTADLYCRAMELIRQCSHNEKLKIFSTLYQISEVDGKVHPKEVRLLIYALKNAGVSLDDVVQTARLSPTVL